MYENVDFFLHVMWKILSNHLSVNGNLSKGIRIRAIEFIVTSA